MTRLGRLVRLATIPETRRLIVAAARSEALREARRRAVHDRAALVRDLGNPSKARDLVRRAAHHPAAAELANAGLLFLPFRYLPLGWAATWATRRVLRRYAPPRTDAVDVPERGAVRPPDNVRPEAPGGDPRTGC